LILQHSNQRLGFAKIVLSSPEVAQGEQWTCYFKPDVDRLLLALAALWEVLKCPQGLLEMDHGLSGDRAQAGLRAALARIGHCLVPDFPPHGMVGKSLDVFIKPVHIQLLHRLNNAGVEHTPTIEKEARVGDLMSQRVLERVLALGEEPSLVQELRGLQKGKPLAEFLLGLLGDGLQQREWHVLADHGRCLEQALVPRVEPVDTGGEDCLRCGRELKALNRSSELVGSTFPAKRA